jgi:hypothetical protein
LPWSTCPIVPTFTCGFVRSNFPFDTASTSQLKKFGAHERDRTADLVLTKDVLYQLSYVGRIHLERVMGIEPT